jgi:hypothetical protein
MTPGSRELDPGTMVPGVLPADMTTSPLGSVDMTVRGSRFALLLCQVVDRDPERGSLVGLLGEREFSRSVGA